MGLPLIHGVSNYRTAKGSLLEGPGRGSQQDKRCLDTQEVFSSCTMRRVSLSGSWAEASAYYGYVEPRGSHDTSLPGFPAERYKELFLVYLRAVCKEIGLRCAFGSTEFVLTAVWRLFGLPFAHPRSRPCEERQPDPSLASLPREILGN